MPISGTLAVTGVICMRIIKNSTLLVVDRPRLVSNRKCRRAVVANARRLLEGQGCSMSRYLLPRKEIPVVLWACLPGASTNPSNIPMPVALQNLEALP